MSTSSIKGSGIKKAVFPVGGRGTRFLPATKALPKEMLPILDKPLIQYAVEEALACGIEEFIFITGKGKTAIEDHFDRCEELENFLQRKKQFALLEKLQFITPKPGQMLYIRQQEHKGLGHAIWCARNLIKDEPFAVLLADDLILGPPFCLETLISSYRQRKGHTIALMEVEKEEISRYGCIGGNVIEESADQKIFHITQLIEKPSVESAPSSYGIVGRYILEPSVFDYLAFQNKAYEEEIQLTDAISYSLEKTCCYGTTFQNQRFDCGNKEGFLQAILHSAIRDEAYSNVFRKFFKMHKDV